MVALTQAHTADLPPETLDEVRHLLDDAFGGRFEHDDWEHTLGGLHVLVREGAELVAHVGIVQRRLLHRDRAIRTGYVEGLAVRADRRRRGLASAAMRAAEQAVRAVYDLGALSDGTEIDGFYEGRGWEWWRGRTWAIGPSGLVRTEEDDGGVLVLRTSTSPELDLSGDIACDWRPGEVW